MMAVRDTALRLMLEFSPRPGLTVELHVLDFAATAFRPPDEMRPNH